MKRPSTVLLRFIFALSFAIRLLCQSVFGTFWRFTHWFIIEVRLVMGLVHLPLFLRNIWLFLRQLMNRRLLIRSIRWRFRPRLGDALLLCCVFLLLLSGLQTQHVKIKQPDMSDKVDLILFDQVDSMTNIPRNSAITTPIALRSVHHVRMRIPAGQSLQSVWHRGGLQVQDSLALSLAFAKFFASSDQVTGQGIDVEMEFLIPSFDSKRQGSDWQLQRLHIDFTRGYSLSLIPQKSVLGETDFEVTMHNNPIKAQRFAIEDTVEGLLLAGKDYIRDAPKGRLSESGVPVYLETLLLFLDRALEAEGGLRSGDMISALYSQPASGSALQLLYVRVQQVNNDLEMVHYRQEFDDEGFMYDTSGRAFVLSDWGEPVTAARVTSNFGMRLHPIKKYSVLHQGIDYSAPIGTPIRATKDGIVLNKQFERNGYGNWIKLKHKDGFSTIYAHLDRFAEGIRLGYPVQKSQIIGYLGNTGLSTGPHLHYEVAHLGEAMDPTHVTKPEMRLLSPRQRQAVKLVLQQRYDQMRLLLANIG